MEQNQRPGLGATFDFSFSQKVFESVARTLYDRTERENPGTGKEVLSVFLETIAALGWLPRD